MGNKYKDGSKQRGLFVEVKDDFNRAFRTFNKKVDESGKMEDVKERMSYEKPAVAKQRKKKQARKRWEREVESLIVQGKWHKDKKY